MPNIDNVRSGSIDSPAEPQNLQNSGMIWSTNQPIPSAEEKLSGSRPLTQLPPVSAASSVAPSRSTANSMSTWLVLRNLSPRVSCKSQSSILRSLSWALFSLRASSPINTHSKCKILKLCTYVCLEWPLRRIVHLQNPSKLTDEQMDKVRRIVHQKLKPFHFQIKLYYLFGANYPSETRL